jgi:hypothetical protein
MARATAFELGGQYALGSRGCLLTAGGRIRGKAFGHVWMKLDLD